MEASLVAATWGLVVVTALLVISTLVPQVIAQRATTKQLAAQIVPDMHILNSNLRAMSNKLLDADDWLKDDTEVEIEEAGQFLRMLGPITQVRSAGLEFASEMFICRHLMTQARFALRRAYLLYDKEGEQALRERDENFERACRLYKAASMTIETAESLLPKESATIDGERFWDRFMRISDERENEAERVLVDARRERRLRRSRD